MRCLEAQFARATARQDASAFDPDVDGSGDLAWIDSYVPQDSHCSACTAAWRDETRTLYRERITRLQARAPCPHARLTRLQARQDWSNAGCDSLLDVSDRVQRGASLDAAIATEVDAIREYAREILDAHCDACAAAWADETIALMSAAARVDSADCAFCLAETPVNTLRLIGQFGACPTCYLIADSAARAGLAVAHVEVVQTGGGCSAYQIETDRESRLIVVTDALSVGLAPNAETAEFAVEVYDAPNAEPVFVAESTDRAGLLAAFGKVRAFMVPCTCGSVAGTEFLTHEESNGYIDHGCPCDGSPACSPYCPSCG